MLLKETLPRFHSTIVNENTINQVKIISRVSFAKVQIIPSSNWPEQCWRIFCAQSGLNSEKHV